VSKGRKGLLKDLNCRNSYEIICGCDIDEELENLIDPGVHQGFHIVNLFVDVIPLFEVEADLCCSHLEEKDHYEMGGIRTRRGFVDDVMDSMK
jgi:hypothetical protein